MIDNKVVVAITQGDINGIGYEVIIKTLSDNRIADFCVPVIYGSPKVAAYHRKAIKFENFNFNQVKDITEINSKRSNIINVMDDNVRVELGKNTEAGGEGSIQALEAAIADIKKGKVDVLVTAPINKQNVQSLNFNFPGHTEFLSSAFDTKDVLMLLVSGTMRVGVVTGHIPLADVSKSLTVELIMDKLRLLNSSLIKDFGIRKPRIAVLGLNPHAGDAGVLGTEEQEIIIPAIEKANGENTIALGPYPADGFFGSENFTKFDAVLAMYHDQGLAPFKSLAFDSGVNYTAGLPIVRTSPAHGTAFEIAGQGVASENSLRNALMLAIDIHRNRLNHEELTKNPLLVSKPE
ncbi:MAG: 4-hydroxythreonine-4-phosphate dehydrogenase PdxA [Bacteroidales bacterium]|jgi:4-hydroxythreonine-4-phosphate dehydrogenase|nr:4-hydroxythreonine-4-phosphate dehydrogenase PdxA [Bacteroidales bacterium]MDD4671590.1 4-hydroxythreonine-4-phosphate dehydrogenase PdxA [Bacteroidales bacterium]MDY0347671.1 4-hydroxythreonine-4-phosphate dehydrogenase PdxA [Tenuifilaceae bacterium]